MATIKSIIHKLWQGFFLTTILNPIEQKLLAHDDQLIEPKYIVELNERDYRTLQEMILIRQKELLSFYYPTEYQKDLVQKKDSFIQIQYPQELTTSEKAQNILKRINKKYIGELPEKIKDIIAYFNQLKTNPEQNSLQHLLVNTILLCGKPGTGKTYLVKTIAQELQIPYMYCNCTAFLDKYYGESAEKIKNFFSIAKNANTPIFLFIDEIDAVALSRENSQSCGETLMTLLTEIQNISFHPHIFIFIATNAPKRLDPALVNRFSGGQIVKIEKLQSKDALIQFFKKSLKDNGFTLEAEIETIACNIYSELYGWKSKLFASNLSFRELERIIPNALARKHNYENLQKKPKQNFIFYTKQAIEDIKNNPLNPQNPKKLIPYAFLLTFLAHTVYAISKSCMQPN